MNNQSQTTQPHETSPQGQQQMDYLQVNKQDSKEQPFSMNLTYGSKENNSSIPSQNHEAISPLSNPSRPSGEQDENSPIQSSSQNQVFFHRPSFTMDQSLVEETSYNLTVSDQRKEGDDRSSFGQQVHNQYQSSYKKLITLQDVPRGSSLVGMGDLSSTVHETTVDNQDGIEKLSKSMHVANSAMPSKCADKILEGDYQRQILTQSANPQNQVLGNLFQKQNDSEGDTIQVNKFEGSEMASSPEKKLSLNVASQSQDVMEDGEISLGCKAGQLSFIDPHQSQRNLFKDINRRDEEDSLGRKGLTKHESLRFEQIGQNHQQEQTVGNLTQFLFKNSKHTNMESFGEIKMQLEKKNSLQDGLPKQEIGMDGSDFSDEDFERDSDQDLVNRGTQMLDQEAPEQPKIPLFSSNHLQPRNQQKKEIKNSPQILADMQRGKAGLNSSIGKASTGAKNTKGSHHDSKNSNDNRQRAPNSQESKNSMVSLNSEKSEPRGYHNQQFGPHVDGRFDIDNSSGPSITKTPGFPKQRNNRIHKKAVQLASKRSNNMRDVDSHQNMDSLQINVTDVEEEKLEANAEKIDLFKKPISAGKSGTGEQPASFESDFQQEEIDINNRRAVNKARSRNVMKQRQFYNSMSKIDRMNINNNQKDYFLVSDEIHMAESWRPHRNKSRENNLFSSPSNQQDQTNDAQESIRPSGENPGVKQSLNATPLMNPQYRNQHTQNSASSISPNQGKNGGNLMSLQPDHSDQNFPEFLAYPTDIHNQQIHRPVRDRSYTFQRNIERENDNNKIQNDSLSSSEQSDFKSGNSAKKIMKINLNQNQTIFNDQPGQYDDPNETPKLGQGISAQNKLPINAVFQFQLAPEPGESFDQLMRNDTAQFQDKKDENNLLLGLSPEAQRSFQRKRIMSQNNEAVDKDNQSYIDSINRLGQTHRIEGDTSDFYENYEQNMLYDSGQYQETGERGSSMICGSQRTPRSNNVRQNMRQEENKNKANENLPHNDQLIQISGDDQEEEQNERYRDRQYDNVSEEIYLAKTNTLQRDLDSRRAQNSNPSVKSRTSVKSLIPAQSAQNMQAFRDFKKSSTCKQPRINLTKVTDEDKQSIKRMKKRRNKDNDESSSVLNIKPMQTTDEFQRMNLNFGQNSSEQIASESRQKNFANNDSISESNDTISNQMEEIKLNGTFRLPSNTNIQSHVVASRKINPNSNEQILGQDQDHGEFSAQKRRKGIKRGQSQFSVEQSQLSHKSKSSISKSIKRLPKHSKKKPGGDNKSDTFSGLIAANQHNTWVQKTSEEEEESPCSQAITELKNDIGSPVARRATFQIPKRKASLGKTGKFKDGTSLFSRTTKRQASLQKQDSLKKIGARKNLELQAQHQSQSSRVLNQVYIGQQLPPKYLENQQRLSHFTKIDDDDQRNQSPQPFTRGKDSSALASDNVDIKSVSQVSQHSSKLGSYPRETSILSNPAANNNLNDSPEGGNLPFSNLGGRSISSINKSQVQNLIDRPLKLSEYNQLTHGVIYQQLAWIKHEFMQDDYHEIPDDKKINFKFKKPGFRHLLIFDLDETLIHCRRDQNEYQPDHDFEADEEISIKDPATGQNICASFSVRPFSRNCLLEANKYFEVAIFTAGNEWFADKIIDFLDPDKSLIQHRYFRQHTCQLSDDDPDMYVKDLSIFKGEVTIDDILIVDNNIYSFAFNLENGIPILNYLGDKKDDQLLRIIKYLNLLKGSKNLKVENERIQELKKMYDSCNWRNFIHYYDPDELSDDLEEPDFDNDGITIKQGRRYSGQEDDEEDFNELDQDPLDQDEYIEGSLNSQQMVKHIFQLNTGKQNYMASPPIKTPEGLSSVNTRMFPLKTLQQKSDGQVFKPRLRSPSAIDEAGSSLVSPEKLWQAGSNHSPNILGESPTSLMEKNNRDTIAKDSQEPFAIQLFINEQISLNDDIEIRGSETNSIEDKVQINPNKGRRSSHQILKSQDNNEVIVNRQQSAKSPVHIKYGEDDNQQLREQFIDKKGEKLESGSSGGTPSIDLMKNKKKLSKVNKQRSRTQLVVAKIVNSSDLPQKQQEDYEEEKVPIQQTNEDPWGFVPAEWTDENSFNQHYDTDHQESRDSIMNHSVTINMSEKKRKDTSKKPPKKFQSKQELLKHDKNLLSRTPEINKQQSSNQLIEKVFPSKSLLKVTERMQYTDQHSDIKNQIQSPMKKIEESQEFSPIRKHPTVNLKGTEKKKQVSTNQGPFFRADNIRLQTDQSHNTLLLKTGPRSSSASKKMQDDKTKSKKSYSTIKDNPIIAPNTYIRKQILDKRNGAATVEKDQQPQPDNTLQKSPSKIQRPDAYLDQLHSQMDKLWKSGAMKSGLMRNNPTLQKKHIIDHGPKTFKRQSQRVSTAHQENNNLAQVELRAINSFGENNQSLSKSVLVVPDSINTMGTHKLEQIQNHSFVKPDERPFQEEILKVVKDASIGSGPSNNSYVNIGSMGSSNQGVPKRKPTLTNVPAIVAKIQGGFEGVVRGSLKVNLSCDGFNEGLNNTNTHMTSSILDTPKNFINKVDYQELQSTTCVEQNRLLKLELSPINNQYLGGHLNPRLSAESPQYKLTNPLNFGSNNYPLTRKASTKRGNGHVIDFDAAQSQVKQYYENHFNKDTDRFLIGGSPATAFSRYGNNSMIQKSTSSPLKSNFTGYSPCPQTGLTSGKRHYDQNMRYQQNPKFGQTDPQIYAKNHLSKIQQRKYLQQQQQNQEQK